MKLVLSLFMIVAAYCGSSNAATSFYGVDIYTSIGKPCDMSMTMNLKKNYQYCIIDEDQHLPFCYIKESYVTTTNWDWCKYYYWNVAFSRSAISNETNDFKDRRYRHSHSDNYAVSKYAGESFALQADFKTNFTVKGDSETGYEIVIPEMYFVNKTLSLERRMFEESMDNLRQILAPFASTQYANWWVKDVNGNNKDYCIVYNSKMHFVRTVNCDLTKMSIPSLKHALVVEEYKLD